MEGVSTFRKSFTTLSTFLILFNSAAVTVNENSCTYYSGHSGEYSIEITPGTTCSLNCPGDITINCQQSTLPSATGTATVSNGAGYSVSYSDQISTTGCTTIITRTWIAAKSGSPSVSCTQTITVTDTTPPVIQPAPAVWTDCYAYSQYTYTATDNCSGNIQIVVTNTDSSWYTPQNCAPGMFRTQTQGGWGANPNGNNPAAYLAANFAAAFPNGLTIGCSNKLVLTSAAAVRDFLPSGTTPKILPAGTMTNPGSGYSNVLAGQLVALTLSVGFDNYSASFGSSPLGLSQLEVVSGPFAGYSIGEILQIANSVIGGCSSQFTPSQLNSVLTSLNENFDNGNQNHNFVDCSLDFDCAMLLNNQVTATDACGNTSTMNQQVILSNSSGPAFSGAPAQINAGCGETPADPIITGNCFGGAINVQYSETQIPGTCSPTRIRTWTATDPCGHSSSFTQTVCYTDDQLPVFLNAPENLVLLCGQVIPDYIPVVTDNCGDPAILMTETETQNGCSRQIIRTWTATDPCGNSASVSQTISFTDNTPPVAVNYLPEITISCDTDPASVNVEFTDECGNPVSVDISDQLICPGCHAFILRTYTATDWCGNSISLEQIINIRDESAPVFVNVPGTVTIDCNSPVPSDLPEVNDNCSEFTLQYFEEFNQGSIGCRQLIRTWIATDACGNVSSATQQVIISDDIPPVFTEMPQNITANCGQMIPVPAVTAIDNCDSDVALTYTETIGSEGCNQTIVRTWTAMDDCGNITQTQQTITLTDEVAPVISAASEVTVNCNSLMSLQIQATDNCSSSVQISSADQILSFGCSYDLERTWTAADACGNVSTFIQLIHVVDNVAPVFTNVPQSYQISCGVLLSNQSPSATDNCGEVTIQLNETTSGTDCNRVITRVWTATDNCGNSSTAQQTITVIDNTAPVILNVPGNINISCETYNGPPAVPSVTASDNCDTTPTINYTQQINPGSCANSMQIVRTWTATDDCGNQTIRKQFINVIDNTPPQIQTIPADVEATCGNMPPVPVIIATDNCGGMVNISYSENNLSGGCPVIQRRWIATDACGNSAFVIQNVHITDNEAPEVEPVPVPDGPVSCNNIPPVQDPAVDDNCDDNVDIQFNESIIGSGCEFTLIRTWVATDDCGNSTVVSQSINVFDSSSPVFVNPVAEVSLTCDQLPLYGGLTATDDCTSQIVYSFTDVVSGSGCSYDILRTYVASDLCGNTSSFTQTLHISDTNAPFLIGLPLNSFASCNNIPNAPTVTAWDACSGNVPVSYSQAIIGSGCNYQIHRTWTATDACNNQIVATRIIYVNDQTPPVITLSQSEISLDCTDMIPPVEVPVITDNCSPAVSIQVVFNQDELISGCSRTIIRSWTATDACNNTSVKNQYIVIQDNTAPVFTNFPADLTTTCDQIPAVASPGVTDNCDSNVEVGYSESIVTTSCPYIIKRTWTAADDCGNTATRSQNISIIDNIKPVLTTVPAVINAECGAIVPVPTVTASDNCYTNIPVVYTETILNAGCSQSHLRRWTATDYCGNQGVAEQTVIFHDTQAPQFPMESETITVDCENIPPVPVIFATDCNSFSQVYTECINPGACPNEYSVLRHWTAIDMCGNGSHYYQTIVVTDYTAPVFTDVPQDLTVTCGDEITDPLPEAVDNCNGDVEITYSEMVVWPLMSDGTPIVPENQQLCVDGKKLVRTWTATDCAGNSTSTSQTITFTGVEERIPFVAEDTNLKFDVRTGSAGQFVIVFSSKITQRVEIRMYDINGRELGIIYSGVAEEGVIYSETSSKSNLATGQYVFRLVGESGVLNDTEPVVK